MIRQHLRRSAPLLAIFLLASCSGDATPITPATTGTITFDVVTTGPDVDADGYLLSIDGGENQPLTANGSTSWTTGAEGGHTIAVSGLAFNCELTSVPATVAVTLSLTTHVAIRASCTPYLQNAIVYMSSEFGTAAITAMRPDGTRRVQITTDQLPYSTPVVSPDGHSVAVAVGFGPGGIWNGTDGIYILDCFGKTRTKVAGRSSLDGTPAWSPDGTKLAFRSESPGPWGAYGRIWVVGRDGSGLHQLTPENADTTDYTFDDSPTWSPDGTQVLYSHNGKLWLINADGTAPTSLGISGMYPAWSPDGSKIAFTWEANGTYAVFIADRDGTNVRQVTQPIQQDDFARWSPDGRQLVFQRVENGILHLFRIDADGSNLTKLSVTPSNEDSPSWNPGT